MSPSDRTPLTGNFRTAASGEAAKTPCPFSLRLTFEERQALEREAGRQSLGAYIRSRLFGGGERQRRSYRKPLKDDQALAKLLGALGESRLANNLNQLAKAANTGSLPITPETENAIYAACRDVERIRKELIAALGLGAGPS